MMYPPVKRRHPRQVLDPSGLVAGEIYAFVLAEPGGEATALVTFAGTLDGCEWEDTIRTLDGCCGPAGFRLTLHCTQPGAAVYGLWLTGGKFKASLAAPSGFRAAGGIRDLLADPPEARRPDGTYGTHKLVVPMADWSADPQVHMADWRDPGAECAATGDWAAEETKLRVRKDAELRRLLGFG